MAKRISLREFQQNLSMKLASLHRGDSVRSMLGIQSGAGDESLWLIDLADSGEVIPLEALVEVPLTRPWFSGMTNVRGVLYSVVDFSAFRGGDTTPRNTDARLLLIGARHGINAALLVSRTLGLRASDDLVPDPEPDLAAPEWGQARYTDSQGRRWRKLHVPTLLAASSFLEVAA